MTSTCIHHMGINITILCPYVCLYTGMVCIYIFMQLCMTVLLLDCYNILHFIIHPFIFQSYSYHYPSLHPSIYISFHPSVVHPFHPMFLHPSILSLPRPRVGVLLPGGVHLSGLLGGPPQPSRHREGQVPQPVPLGGPRGGGEMTPATLLPS